MARQVINTSEIRQVVETISAGAANDLEKRAPDSGSMVEYWDLTDDLVAGAGAIRNGREKYLPEFPEEDKKDYEFRLSLSKYTNIYRDIIESLAAKPFEEEITLIENDKKSVPDPIKDFIENVDGSGANLTAFASHTFFNGINSAIDWIFIDYPKVDPQQIRSVEDAKREGIRPFWTHVLGRNVLEARVTVSGKREVLTYIRILEPGLPNHIRVFERLPNGVIWTLYRESGTSRTGVKEYVIEDTGTVTIGVIPLVPFITGRRSGRTFKVYPVMRDAADLQIELYWQESSLKYTKTLAAYPMLSGNGVKPPTGPDGKTPLKIKVGPNRTLYAPPDGSGKSGEWKYVEPAGNTLTFLSGDVETTKKDLREIGRQPLTAQSGNLTVITTMVAAGKAKSAVGAWALNLKNTLENAMVITCLWFDIDKDVYDPELNVYNEFDEFNDDGKDAENLLKMRATGDLSQETLWYEMKRRRTLSPDFDKEKELKLILAEVPSDDGLDDDPEAPELKPTPKPGNPPAPKQNENPLP